METHNTRKMYGVRQVWHTSPDGGRTNPLNFWRSHGEDYNDPILFDTRKKAVEYAAQCMAKLTTPVSFSLIAKPITPRQLAHQRAWRIIR